MAKWRYRFALLRDQGVLSLPVSISLVIKIRSAGVSAPSPWK
jgi:hypothetical protein